MRRQNSVLCVLYIKKILENLYFYANKKQSDAECWEMDGFCIHSVACYTDSVTTATRQVPIGRPSPDKAGNSKPCKRKRPVSERRRICGWKSGDYSHLCLTALHHHRRGPGEISSANPRLLPSDINKQTNFPLTTQRCYFLSIATTTISERLLSRLSLTQNIKNYTDYTLNPVRMESGERSRLRLVTY